MNIMNHRDFLFPQLLCDADESEFMTQMAAGVLELTGNGKEALNAALATIEPEQIVCFVTTISGCLHAGYTVIHDGKNPSEGKITLFKGLSRDRALGESLRMAQEFEQEHPDLRINNGEGYERSLE